MLVIPLAQVSNGWRDKVEQTSQEATLTTQETTPTSQETTPTTSQDTTPTSQEPSSTSQEALPTTEESDDQPQTKPKPKDLKPICEVSG